MIQLQDPESDVSKKGSVIVVLGCGPNAKQVTDPGTNWKISALGNSLPELVVGVHLCFDPDYLAMNATMVAVGKYALEVATRHRLRTHVGK